MMLISKNCIILRLPNPQRVECHTSRSPSPPFFDLLRWQKLRSSKNKSFGRINTAPIQIKTSYQTNTKKNILQRGDFQFPHLSNTTHKTYPLSPLKSPQILLSWKAPPQ
jgi:hypothetical protein